MQSGFKNSQVANMQTDEKIEIVSKLNRAQNTLKTINELIIFMAEMNAERFEFDLNSVIKLKIYSAIEKISASNTKCKTVLLYLPAGGKHDLPLLYLNYLFQ